MPPSHPSGRYALRAVASPNRRLRRLRGKKALSGTVEFNAHGAELTVATSLHVWEREAVGSAQERPLFVQRRTSDPEAAAATPSELYFGDLVLGGLPVQLYRAGRQAANVAAVRAD